MSKAPAFQFYAHDFLAGRVATYSLEEIGAYALLLAFDWSLSGLPLDADSLARLCRVSRRKFDVIWRTIAEQFVEVDGKLYNPRLAKEREKQELWRSKSSTGGKKSASERAKGRATTVEPPLQPKAQPKGNTPSPSPTPVTTRTTRSKEKPSDAGASAAGMDALPKATVDGAYERWSSKLGAVNYGAMRKALQPLFTAKPRIYTAAQLAGAVDAFHEGASDDSPKFRGKWTVQKFAAELHNWVRLGAMELVDEWGAPTERGRSSGIFHGAQ